MVSSMKKKKNKKEGYVCVKIHYFKQAVSEIHEEGDEVRIGSFNR